MEGRQEPKDQEQEIRAAGRREQALRLIEDSLPGAGDSSIFPSMELPGDLKSGLRLVEGARIGDFQLVRLAGRGGMGEVWEAEQLSLQRRVALKLLFADRANELGIEFFAREARAGGRLSHPGIVSVYGAGEDEGIHWIAMELIEGSFDLKASIEDLRSREEELGPDFHLNAAELVAGVADSLEVAHRAGIVHRDIKPGNILVTRQDEPVVTDFGLAKMLDEHSISRAGDIVGSHHYMSPELVAGKRAGIDHRSDIFSLGVVLYELLTLARPFQGDTSQQVTRKILVASPASPTEVRSRIPRDLSVICMKALEKDPARRYPSMAELAGDLRRFLAGEPILARPAGPLERLIGWAHRNRAAAAVLVALSLGAGGTTVASLIAGQRAQELRVANQRLEAEKVDVEYALSMVRNLLMTSFEPNALGFLLEEAAERGANPTIVTRLQRHLQTVDFAEVSRKALEARLARMVTTIESGAFEGSPEARIRVRRIIAQILHHPLASHERALEQQLVVTEELGSLVPADDPGLQAELTFLATLHRDAGDLDRATLMARELLAAEEELRGRSSRGSGHLLALLASIELRRGHAAGSVELYREAVAVLEGALGPEHHDPLVERRELGIALVANGQAREGKEELTRLIEGGYSEIQGTLRGYVHSALGDACLTLGEPELALDAFEKAATDLEPSLGVKHEFSLAARAGIEEATRRLEPRTPAIEGAEGERP